MEQLNVLPGKSIESGHKRYTGVFGLFSAEVMVAMVTVLLRILVANLSNILFSFDGFPALRGLITTLVAHYKLNVTCSDL